MEITEPLTITPRLMAGVQIDSAWVQVEPTGEHDRHGKPGWQYWVDIEAGEFGGSDLFGWDDTRGMVGTLLSFLTAAAESYRYAGYKCEPDTNSDLFPEPVCAWAAENSDELEMLREEIESSDGERS